MPKRRDENHRALAALLTPVGSDTESEVVASVVAAMLLKSIEITAKPISSSLTLSCFFENVKVTVIGYSSRQTPVRRRFYVRFDSLPSTVVINLL